MAKAPATSTRPPLVRLAGIVATIALVIGLGALLVSRIASANQVVKQAPKITTPTMVGATAPNLTLTSLEGRAAGAGGGAGEPAGPSGCAEHLGGALYAMTSGADAAGCERA